jgi:hypothetical protein
MRRTVILFAIGVSLGLVATPIWCTLFQGYYSPPSRVVQKEKPDQVQHPELYTENTTINIGEIRPNQTGIQLFNLVNHGRADLILRLDRKSDAHKGSKSNIARSM